MADIALYVWLVFVHGMAGIGLTLAVATLRLRAARNRQEEPR